MPLGWLVDATSTTLLAVVVLAILFGFLPTRRSYQDMKAERDRWQEIALESMEQTRELLISARAAQEVLSRMSEPEDKS